MVSLPGSDSALAEIGAFYSSNRTVVLIAQVLGLTAAIALARFASNLAEMIDDVRARTTGLVLATAAGVTALPVVGLTQGGDPSPTLVAMTDLTDAVLFLAIASFLGVLTSNQQIPMGIRVICLVAAGLTLARGVLGLLAAPTILDAIAPLAFLAAVIALAVWAFRAGPVPSEAAR